MTNYHPEDRPDPAEQPIRARVPEHISGGAFSTGVIVMTAQAEFILDFVQNLGRPHQIVARVIMPHNVLPQLVDALQRNIELYRGRWGELPQTGLPAPAQVPWQAPSGATQKPRPSIPQENSGGAPEVPGAGGPASGPAQVSQNAPNQISSDASSGSGGDAAGGNAEGGPSSSSQATPPAGSGARQASAQEIYDDLKIRDELLSGAYANAVMIGHGPHEFSFDFITNFYPHSAVSSRVFLAAGQVPRLYDSLKGTWEQLRSRMNPPGGQSDPPPYQDPEDYSDDS